MGDKVSIVVALCVGPAVVIVSLLVLVDPTVVVVVMPLSVAAVGPVVVVVLSSFLVHAPPFKLNASVYSSARYESFGKFVHLQHKLSSFVHVYDTLSVGQLVLTLGPLHCTAACRRRCCSLSTTNDDDAFAANNDDAMNATADRREEKMNFIFNNKICRLLG